MNGVTSAIVASRMMPIRNMKISAMEKFQSRKMRSGDERALRGQGIDEEEIEADDGQDRLDDDLARIEPALLLSAVEHHLQRADAERQRQEAEPGERRRRGGSALSRMKAERPSTVRMPNGRLTKNTQRQE